MVLVADCLLQVFSLSVALVGIGCCLSVSVVGFFWIRGRIGCGSGVGK